MVRTRNLTCGQVIPHKDFVELSEKKEAYIRVLIPLETCFSAYHSDEGIGIFRMQKGDIWVLDASLNHAAYNFTNDSRIILCLDFQYQERHQSDFNIIFSQENRINIMNNVEPMIFNRAPLTESDLDELVMDIGESITTLDDIKPAILKISSIHVHHDIPITKIYDTLIKSVKSKSDNIQLICQKLKKYYIIDRQLGQRFTLL